MIDLYCERLGPGFWEEPINALSNFVFLVAAYYAWTLANKERCFNHEIKLLSILSVMIGLGSFTFHTLATRWALLLDLIPILLFQLLFFWLYSRKIMAMSTFSAVTMLSLFMLMILLGKIYPQYLNGSLMYVPTLLMLSAMGLFHFQRRLREPALLLLAAALFLSSFSFRTLDNRWCEVFPLGTHFLWHLSGGLTVYLLIRSLILNWPQTKNLISE